MIEGSEGYSFDLRRAFFFVSIGSSAQHVSPVKSVSRRARKIDCAPEQCDRVLYWEQFTVDSAYTIDS